MRNDLLDRIPDDLLLIIFRHIRPSVKYKLTKTYFNKFYFIRLGYINNKILLHNVKRIVKYECYIIKNYNYIKYVIRNDLLFVIKNVLDYKLSNDKSKYILKKPMIFENIKFINFIDFCNLLCLKYKSKKVLEYINKIIVENDVKISKEYKSYDRSNSNKLKNNLKNKNINWIA